MSINTDSIVDISSGGINYGKIGISKTLDSLDLDDVFDSVYCSASCQTLCAPKQSYNAPSAFFEDVTAPLTFVSQEYGRWNYGNQEICYNLASGTDNSDDPLYARIIWLYSESTFYVSITNDNASGYSLVTQLNAQQWDINVSDLSNYNSWGNRPKPSAFTDTGIEFMPYYSLFIYEESDTAHTGSSLQYGRIEPYLIYKFNDKICITSLWFFDSWYSQGLKYVQGDTTNYAQSALFKCYDKSTLFAFETSMAVSSPIKTWGLDSYYDFFGTDHTEDYIMCFYKVNSTEQHYFSIAPQNLDALNTWLSRCGFFFKTDKRYKPVISGGYVTGYTDDLTAASDFDNYTGDMQHDVPDTPGPGPGPGPSPGYDDDPWSGASFSGVGVGGAGAFAKCYYMTSTELANLRSWMNSINVPEGFDPMQQIIGLSQVPVALSGSGPENVVFVNSSAVYDPGVTTRAVDTGVATQQAMGTPISYYLGSVDIVRRMQERGEPYLDYDCQIELYLPLIGMFSLDTQAVMGRTISAYAVLDPVSGTLAAYAYVTKDGQNLPVAYGSTTIGVDLPISAQQLSVSRAALKQANAQLGASLLSGALTMLAAASSSGKSSGAGTKTSTGSSGLSAAGIREAGSDYMKASQVGNVFGDFMNWGRTIRQLSYGNNTAVAGSFGGSTAQWSYPFTPYVKMIRPRYEKPSNYAHSQGVPCVQTKTIGSCTGFIQCIGADVSGITGATDLELQAIQAALSNGIYAGGGQ